MCTSPEARHSEREASHANPEATDSPVINKQQSPPSNRPTLGPHLSPPMSANEQDSPERILQKEKLHAELKQVLSERSYLRKTQSTLTNMDVNSQENSKNKVEKGSHLSELVEVVVETQAEVGASGYSVVGGGERGIFVKDVLKDSPAAKHLSLQKGDQLLSARVYFDNVKYEDALKILQCAEPYKMSLVLKRTVPENDINICPGARSHELRGPKAKTQKMSVKSVKPFKAKKKRGGQFGFKKLKDNTGARVQLDTEGSPDRSDLTPVDVEFAVPNFKIRKGGKVSVDGSQQLEGVATSTRKNGQIRFPQIKAMDAFAGQGNVNAGVLTHKADEEISGANLKAKAKGPKFGINFPKIKKSKLDVLSSNDNVEVKEIDAKLKPPSTELDFSMSQKKSESNDFDIGVKEKTKDPETKMPKTNIDMLDSKTAVPKIKLPKTRLSCLSDEIDGEKTDTPENKLTMSTDGPVKIKGTAELKDAKMPNDPNVKAPKISMSKVDTSITKINLDPKQNFRDDVDGSVAEGNKIYLSKLDIAVPKTETSNVDISLPTIDVSLPKMTLKNIHTERQASTETDFEMPKLDICHPEISPQEGEIVIQKPEKGEIFYMPPLDISLPKGKLERNCVLEEDVEKREKFKISNMETFLPTIKLQNTITNLEKPEIKTQKLNMPNISMLLAKGKTGPSDKVADIQMSQTDISLTNIKVPEGTNDKGEVQAEKCGMSTMEISLPKGKAEGNAEVTDPSVKGDNFKMPYVDVLFPKMKLITNKINTEHPGFKVGKSKMPSIDIALPLPAVNSSGVEMSLSKCQMPSTDITLPTGEEVGGPEPDLSNKKINSPEGDMSLEAPDSKSGTLAKPSDTISLSKSPNKEYINFYDQTKKRSKFQIPPIDLFLSRIKSRNMKINVEGPEVKGSKPHIPSIEVTLSKDKTEGSFDVEGHSGTGTNFEMPENDMSLLKVKVPEGEIKTERQEIKKAQFKISSAKTSFSKGKMEGDVSPKGNNKGASSFEVPSIDISCPKNKFCEDEIHFETHVKGGRCHIYSADTSLKVQRAEEDVKPQAAKEEQFEMPELDVSLPKLKSAGNEIVVENPNIQDERFHMPSKDISLPGGRAAEDVEEHAGKGGRFEMTNVDVSLPKLKSLEGDSNAEDSRIKSTFKAEKGFELKDDTQKCQRFLMPIDDILIPKLNQKEHAFIEDQDKKERTVHIPNIDIAMPKTQDSDAGATGTNISDLNDPDVTVGRNIKMPSVKIPSAPRVSLDVTFPKREDSDRENNELQKAESEMPSCGTSFDVLDISVKMSKSSLPKFGRKLKSEDKELVSPGCMDLPSVEINGNIKNTTIKMSSKTGKFKDAEMDMMMEIQDKKEKVKMPAVETSLSTTGFPECHEPKTEVDVSEAVIKSYEGSLKIPKMPATDKSIPKTGLDVSMPKVKLNESMYSNSADLNVSSIRRKVNFPHNKIPEEDISLSRGKSGDTDNLQVECEGGQNNLPKTPTVDISLPKISFPKGKTGENYSPELEAGGGGCFIMTEAKRQSVDMKLPTVDISLFKQQFKDIAIPELQTGKENGEAIVPDNKLSTAGISLSHDKMGTINLPEFNYSGASDTFNMTNIKDAKVDMSLSHKTTGDIRTPELEFKVKGGTFEVSDIKIPTKNVSLLHVQSNFDASEPVAVGGQHKMADIRIPKLNITIPQEMSTAKTELPHKTDSTPTEPKGNNKGTKVELGSAFNIGMSKVKASALESDVTNSGEKSLNISEEGNDANLMVNFQGKESPVNRPNTKPPDLDFVTVDTNTSEKDKKQAAKINIPKFWIPLPSLSSPKASLKTSHVKGCSVKVDPKKLVKKAVSVKVNPQMESTAVVGGETNAENEDVKLRLPKIKMKPSFSKSQSNEKTKSINNEEEPKTGKLKLPRITFSSGKIGSPDVILYGSDDGTSSNLNGDKNDKKKLKLPEVEFFSPYSKEKSEEEERETSKKTKKEGP